MAKKTAAASALKKTVSVDSLSRDVANALCIALKKACGSKHTSLVCNLIPLADHAWKAYAHYVAKRLIMGAQPIVACQGALSDLEGATALSEKWMGYDKSSYEQQALALALRSMSADDMEGMASFLDEVLA
jgi:hypothetical protein